MSYGDVETRLQDGDLIILDGGTGTELERRGVSMDVDAWCGAATLGNVKELEEIHSDYISAGADIITANTYASSRLMLEPAGFSDRFEEINRTAVHAALRARDASGRNDVLVAGSLSHMCPIIIGNSRVDLSRAPPQAKMVDTFSELATLLGATGCDLIILEMMYDPKRIGLVFEAAAQTGLPVWAGFSARRGPNGNVLSFAREREIPFREITGFLDDYDVAAAGVMHSDSNVIHDAVTELKSNFTGSLMAYPDSGNFEMPHWQFEDIITPEELLRFATDWVTDGVQIIGGCCGLSPEHITALKPLTAG